MTAETLIAPTDVQQNLSQQLMSVYESNQARGIRTLLTLQTELVDSYYPPSGTGYLGGHFYAVAAPAANKKVDLVRSLTKTVDPRKMNAVFQLSGRHLHTINYYNEHPESYERGQLAQALRSDCDGSGKKTIHADSMRGVLMAELAENKASIRMGGLEVRNGFIQTELIANLIKQPCYEELATMYGIRDRNGGGLDRGINDVSQDNPSARKFNDVSTALTLLNTTGQEDLIIDADGILLLTDNLTSLFEGKGIAVVPVSFDMRGRANVGHLPT